MENIKMKLELQSIPSSVAVASSAFASFINQVNPNLYEVSDIRTALSEAVANCIYWAYAVEEQVGTIYITATLKGENLTITVRDRGIGIVDVEWARTPLYTTLPKDHSGMGFTVMESSMDNVKVRSTPGKGTTVTMKKLIHGK